jgi:hypothetical protein
MLPASQKSQQLKINTFSNCCKTYNSGEKFALLLSDKSEFESLEVENVGSSLSFDNNFAFIERNESEPSFDEEFDDDNDIDFDFDFFFEGPLLTFIVVIKTGFRF